MSTEKRSTVYMAERHLNPAEAMAGAKRENYTWAAILTIVSTLVILGMLGLLWVDYASLSVA